VRPWEFEIPAELDSRTSILESSSFHRRLGGQLNRNLKSPTAATAELRSAAELNPSQQSLGPTPPRVRPLAELNPGPRRLVPPPLAPPPLQVHPNGGMNIIPKNLAPAPRQVRRTGQLSPAHQSPAPLTGRVGVARNRVSARFELLPDPKPRWNRIGVSAVGQLAFLGLLLLSPMLFPQQMETALRFDVVELMQPITHMDIPPATPPPPPKVKPQPKPIVPKPKPVEVQPPELNPKQPHVFLVLKPELKKAHTVEAKPVELKPVFAQAEIVLSTNQPKRPKEEIKAPILHPMRKEDVQAPSLGAGALPATVVAAASKVQTGGFGDPHGIHGPANPSKAANINQAGSPNLPGGPGQGNGTGGAQGVRGTVASGGSNGNGAATAGASTGVSILYEPNPDYSSEARILKMEGDVVLEVVFLASGQVQVVRVLSGLGHGLDEAAVQAAKLIRFKPAQRNGQPVDFHARVRIEFRLSK
jgi:TonB family protein